MTYIPATPAGQLLSGQNMWEKPPVPNALDDEFESAVLDAAWVFTGFGQALDFGTAPDPYAQPTSHRAATAQHRGGPGAGSWLFMQLEAGAGNGGIQKPLGVLPANQFYWARLSGMIRNDVAPTILDGRIGMSIFETGTMASSIPTNSCTVALIENDRSPSAPAIQSGFWARVDGTGFVDLTFTAPRQDVNDEDYAEVAGYVAVQKLGNIYHGWVSHSEQGWLYMGEVENDSGADWDSIAVWGNNVIDTGPGAMIIGVDFVRVVDGIFLP